MRRLLGLALWAWLGTVSAAVAQDSTLEVWPEVDLWYRVTPTWRLSLFNVVTKNVESRYRELNVSFHADYAWGRATSWRPGRLVDEDRWQTLDAWLVRFGVLGGRSMGDGGQSYSEIMPLAELHRRMPFEGNLLLAHRLRGELRWMGDEADLSWRVRYRLLLEKEFRSGDNSRVPFLSVEPFYDSRYDAVTRVRTVGGASVSWTSSFALEGSLTWQWDPKAPYTNVYAFNLILHLFFESDPVRSSAAG